MKLFPYEWRLGLKRVSGRIRIRECGKEEKMLGNTPYSDYLVPRCDYISGLILQLYMPLRP